MRKTVALAGLVLLAAAWPVFASGGARALVALALGIAVSAGCTLSADLLTRLARRLAPKNQVRAAFLGPILRLGAMVTALVWLRLLTSVDLQALVLAVALTYPVFLIPSALWLAREMERAPEVTA